MHEDVEKLVNAGRISSAVGEKLTTLAPHSYVLHSSWGAGQVKEWDLFGGKVTIDFEKTKDQVMGLKLALQKLSQLEQDDLRVQRFNSFDELRELADSDPGEVVVRLLDSHGGRLFPDQIDAELSGSLIDSDKYKKWWDRAKKSLRETKRANVPTKRTEALTLRNENESPIESLVKKFEEARNLKAMIKTLSAVKTEDEALIKDTSYLDRIVKQVEDTASRSLKLHGDLTLELLCMRDEFIDLVEDYNLPENGFTIKDALQEFTGELVEATSSLASVRQRRIYDAFPQAFGEGWKQKILAIFNKIGTRGVAEIAKILEDKEESEVLDAHIKKALSLRTLGPDALSWICRERNRASKSSFCHEVGLSVLNIIESDYLEDGPRKSNRLQAFVMEDRELITDFLQGVEGTDVSNFAKKLLNSPAFPDLDRKSLMARIIKIYPETGDLMKGAVTKRDKSLIVSWASLERKKEEYRDLVENRIPQNIKDISIARSYGDLRENFEYKAAKDMQAVLNRRKGEVGLEINRAKGTDFSKPDTSAVNIGTIVTLKKEDGSSVDYTILGAWDGDPETKTLSYQSVVAKGLMGQKVGANVIVQDFETEENIPFTIENIRAYA